MALRVKKPGALMALAAAVFLGLLQVVLAAKGDAAKEQEKVSPVSTAISVMLLGAIGFQMVIFYMVNAPDRDIMRYSWQVISQTISIFCAVLMFQAFNGLVEEYVIGGEAAEKETPNWAVFIDMCQMLVWLFVLQTVLAVTSGAVGDPPAGGLEEVELNVKSFSVLFAHIAGFSAINAWGSVQQHMLQDSPAKTLLVMPIGILGLLAVYSVLDVIRAKVSLLDDGEVDIYEEKWLEETEEAENDVMAIALSFLFVQSIRFYISGPGGLPNQEGIEPWKREVSHRAEDWAQLYTIGVLFVIFSFILLQLLERIPKEKYKRLNRFLDIMNNFFTFGNAWCFFYASKWMMGSIQILADSHEPAMVLVTLAIFLSGVSFGFIIVLDALRDREAFGSGETAEQAIEKIIQALGILVGFSWEQCFDVAVSVVSVGNKALPPSATRLLMSFVLVMIVFPAWRNHILKTEQDLLDELTEDGQTKKWLADLTEEHCKLFMNAETSEADLDYYHLKMKTKRRKAHGHHHPHIHNRIERHLVVTSNGVQEVDPALVHGHHRHHHHHGHHHGHKHNSGHHHGHEQDFLKERLLDEH